MVGLDNGAGFRFEVDGILHLILEKEVVDECVCLVSGLLICHDDAKDILADGDVQPRTNDEVLAAPLRLMISSQRCQGNMVGEVLFILSSVCGCYCCFLGLPYWSRKLLSW